ncbi:hypothetical protein AgCh_029599 [Apium graveolens]
MEARRSPHIQKLRSPLKGKVVELVAYTDSESTDEDIKKEVPKENQHNNKRRDKDSSMEENITMPPVKWKKARAKRPQLSLFVRKKWVEKSGFGALLDFDLEMIPSKLSSKVVQAFDHKSVMIEIEKGNIEITEEDIFYVLGLPHGGKKVEPVTNEETSRRMKEWLSQFPNEQITAARVVEKIREERNVTEMFKINFLVVLSNVLIGTTTHSVVQLVERKFPTFKGWTEEKLKERQAMEKKLLNGNMSEGETDDKELNDDGKSAQQKVTNDIDNNDRSWPNEENITEMSKKKTWDQYTSLDDDNFPNQEHVDDGWNDWPQAKLKSENCNTDEMGEHRKDGQECIESISIVNEEDDKSEDNISDMAEQEEAKNGEEPCNPNVEVATKNVTTSFSDERTQGVEVTTDKEVCTPNIEFSESDGVVNLDRDPLSRMDIIDILYLEQGIIPNIELSESEKKDLTFVPSFALGVDYVRSHFHCRGGEYSVYYNQIKIQELM